MWACSSAPSLLIHGYLILVVFHLSFLTETSSTGDRPFFAEPIPNTTIAAGREVTLPCIVNNLGDSKVAWIHTDKHTLLTLHDRVITRNTRYSINHNGFRTWWLSIKDVEESDKGEYMCQINTSPMISQSGYLEVVVPPKIDENNTSSDTEVREGSDVTLQCRASGSPTPTIKWRRENQKDLQPGMKINSGMEGEYLNISKVTRLHMAAYLCIATNGVQPSVSKRIMLNVKFAPMIWIPTQLVGAPLDTDVLLDCGLESFPKSVTYWKKDSGVIILSNNKYDSVLIDKGSYQSRMHLKIRDLNPEDYGSYTCVAKNSLGETEGTIKLYEIPRPTTTSSPAPLTSRTSKTSTQHTTSEKILLGTWQNSIVKDDSESAKKTELSTELQEKDSTNGGIAAAAASDHEYREEESERKESRRRLNDDIRSAACRSYFYIASLFILQIFILNRNLL